jgi:putative FmdB family regulatory protein
MPVYPYNCENCDHTFEDIAMMNDAPLVVCPVCRRRRLRRVLCVPNVIVRGNPKTIGQLAEDNTRSLVAQHGKERAREMIDENTYGQGGKKLKLPKGAAVLPRPEVNEIPWFRTGEVPGTGPRSEVPIDLSKIKDKARYIRTGEKD